MNPWTTSEQQEFERQMMLRRRDGVGGEREAAFLQSTDTVSPEPAEAPITQNPWSGRPYKVNIKATPAPGMPGGRTWSIKQEYDK